MKTFEQIAELEKRYLLGTYNRYPIVLMRAWLPRLSVGVLRFAFTQAVDYFEALHEGVVLV